MGVVAVRQVSLGDRLGAADAFGYVLPGHLDMDAAGMRAFAAVDVEEAPGLLEDEIESPRLVAAAAGLDRIAVHRIARPHHDLALALDGANERGKMLADLLGAEACDERESPRLVLRIERVYQLEQLVSAEARTDLCPDRILDAAEILEMRVVELARAVADPEHMPRGGVPLARGRNRRE